MPCPIRRNSSREVHWCAFQCLFNFFWPSFKCLYIFSKTIKFSDLPSWWCSCWGTFWQILYLALVLHCASPLLWKFPILFMDFFLCIAFCHFVNINVVEFFDKMFYRPVWWWGLVFYWDTIYRWLSTSFGEWFTYQWYRNCTLPDMKMILQGSLGGNK